MSFRSALAAAKAKVAQLQTSCTENEPPGLVDIPSLPQPDADHSQQLGLVAVVLPVVHESSESVERVLQSAPVSEASSEVPTAGLTSSAALDAPPTSVKHVHQYSGSVSLQDSHEEKESCAAHLFRKRTREEREAESLAAEEVQGEFALLPPRAAKSRVAEFAAKMRRGEAKIV